MARTRLLGIDPDALASALQERHDQHRITLDQLRARLAQAEARLAELRGRQSRLTAELGRLDSEAQHLLEEMNRLGEDTDRPVQALTARYTRAEEALNAGIALLQQEREGWDDLERRIAEGVLAAVQPYLDVTALLPEGGPDHWGDLPAFSLRAEKSDPQPGGEPHG